MVFLVCIGCPRGCQLSVDVENDYAVTGNNCLIGEEYAKHELTHATRVLTTTVAIQGGLHRRLPVKSASALPKELLLEASRALKDVEVVSPVKCGDVIVSNILNTGIDIISCKNM